MKGEDFVNFVDVDVEEMDGDGDGGSGTHQTTRTPPSGASLDKRTGAIISLSPLEGLLPLKVHRKGSIE